VYALLRAGRNPVACYTETPGPVQRAVYKRLREKNERVVIMWGVGDNVLLGPMPAAPCGYGCGSRAVLRAGVG